MFIHRAILRCQRDCNIKRFVLNYTRIMIALSKIFRATGPIFQLQAFKCKLEKRAPPSFIMLKTGSPISWIYFSVSLLSCRGSFIQAKNIKFAFAGGKLNLSIVFSLRGEPTSFVKFTLFTSLMNGAPFLLFSSLFQFSFLFEIAPLCPALFHCLSRIAFKNALGRSLQLPISFNWCSIECRFV